MLWLCYVLNQILAKRKEEYQEYLDDLDCSTAKALKTDSNVSIRDPLALARGGSQNS